MEGTTSLISVRVTHWGIMGMGAASYVRSGLGNLLVEYLKLSCLETLRFFPPFVFACVFGREVGESDTFTHWEDLFVGWTLSFSKRGR